MGRIITFEPIQEGTGDPSPDNVRPILPPLNIDGIGTVYGGFVDFDTGILTRTWHSWALDGVTYGASNLGTYSDESEFTKCRGFTYVRLVDWNNDIPYNDVSCFKCSHFFWYTYSSRRLLTPDVSIAWTSSARYVTFCSSTFTTLEEYNDWLKEQYDNGTPVKTVVKRSAGNYTEYQLTPEQLTEAYNQLVVTPPSMLEKRRRMIMSQPHLTTLSANPLTFQTDVSANLKDCKIYFEPVQEGSGDPSPDNVRPIVGWDGVTVYKTGKNLLNLDGLVFATPSDTSFSNKNKRTFAPNSYCKNLTVNNYMQSVVTDYSVSSDRISITTTARAYGLIVPITGLIAGQRYSFSATILNDGTMAVGFWEKDGTWISKTSTYSSGSFSFVVPEYTYYTGLSFNPGSDSSQAVFTNVQLELGSEATAYEPFKSFNQLTLPFPQTIYGGYVDLVKGEVVETYASVTLDGENVKLNNGDYPSNNFYGAGWVYANPRGVGRSSGKTYFCDKLTLGFNAAIIPHYQTPYGGDLYYIIRVLPKTDYPDGLTKAEVLDLSNEWLQQNPVTVVYPLKASNSYALADGLTHITLGQDISPRPNGRSSTGGYANSSVIGSDGCTFVYFELGWTTEEFLQYSADISRRSEFVSDSRVLTSSTTTNAKLGEMVLSTASTTDYDGDALVYLYVSLPSDCTDLESKRAYLAEHPIKITYPKKTPIPYTVDLTDLKPVKGTNNVWSNANGNIEIGYWGH